LGAFQAELALEERLRFVVEVERRGVLVAGGREAAFGQERGGHLRRFGAVDGELDRGFGKRAPEVAERHRAADERHGQAAEDEAPVARLEAIQHRAPPPHEDGDRRAQTQLADRGTVNLGYPVGGK
jgi:hypothetical protein